MGRLLRVDEHFGVNQVVADAAAITPTYRGNKEGTYSGVGGQSSITDPSLWYGFTHLSYDGVRDYLIISTGNAGYLSAPYSINEDGFPFTTNSDWIHVLVYMSSLDPSKTLSTPGLTAFVFPMEGSGSGFFTDPNTERFYQGWNYYISPIDNIDRDYHTNIGAGEYRYGEIQIVVGSIVNGYFWQNTGFSGEIGNKPGPPPMYDVWGVKLSMLIPITLDDIIVYPNDGFLWSSKRPSGASYAGSVSMPYERAMACMPAGRDKICLMWWASTGDAAKSIWCAILRFNRRLNAFKVENIDIVPTSFNYEFYRHQGWFTYDYKRNMLIGLEDIGSNEFKLVRYTFSEFCHPVSPNQILSPSPTKPVHAGREITFECATYNALSPQNINLIHLDYTSDIPLSHFSVKPGHTTATVNGVGSFTVGFHSAASNDIVTIECTVSSHSVVVSSTIPGVGIKYGIENMIISSQATFTVSGFVSASLSSTTVIGSTVIIAKKLPLTLDAVGAGTPRELVYPTGLLPSPLVYELNPHQWTNMADEALVRPLYANAMTLTKTVNTQFVGDITDIEIVETWLGGGGRAAMTYQFFSMLYDYFRNAPNISDNEYIQWRPKDLNNHTYNVILTGLSVGGSHNIKLDTLAKKGIVYETVELTMRIISQVE